MLGTLILNRYELLEKIGEGGMGIVYKAKCTLLNRFVAIKILKAELNNSDEFITRFKVESKSIASLSHPNIVNIYDAGSENNINFIVMEYVNGKTLKQLIKDNGSLSLSNTLKIACQIAQAIECAHKNKIIHRDIKPDNILITEDNTAKLMDFGIAKVTDSITITYPNKIIGSVHYFSPEQAKGKFVDSRTDIYSFGIVMYEMLTGKVPYNAELPITVAMMHIQEPIIPPKNVKDNIPDNINKIILKMLEKDPINRFQSASELINILKALNEDINLKVSFNNRSSKDKTVIIESNKSLANDENLKLDSTIIMDNVSNLKTSIINKDQKNIKLNYNFRTIKNISLIFIFICITTIIGLIWKYNIKDSYNTKEIASDNIINETYTNEISKENTELPKSESILIPSLIILTQNEAESIIADNGFLLGNITNEYSDTVPKGLIISQSPVSNTYYEKNTKIDLIISLGPKVNEVVQQTNKNENANEKSNNNGNGKSNKNKDKNKDKNNKKD